MDRLHISSFTVKYTILVVTSVVLLATNPASTESSSKQSYKILEGNNLLVICNATEGPDTDIYWTKNDTKSSFRQDGKRLEILGIKRSYSGDYICHSLNTSYPVPEYNMTDVNVTVEVINVDVQYPAEIDEFYATPYMLIENKTFTISCDFQANPYPVWTIRNRDTGRGYMAANLPAKATMTSPPATCEDSGFWECTGYNSLSNGVNVTRGHNITVLCAPKPQFGQNTYFVRETVGNHVELVMRLRSNPRPTYTWTKDDGTDISKLAIQKDSDNETKLVFQPLSVHCFGNYTLKMQNKYGTYYAMYQLVTDGSPERPTNLAYFDVTYDNVKLKWTSGYDMGSKQHFIIAKYDRQVDYHYRFSDRIYDNSNNHGIKQNWTYTLSGLESNHLYNLSVMSENARGFRSDYANPSVIFRTKKSPYDDRQSSSNNVKLAVGITVGIIGSLAVLAFILYFVKYKRLRTSYVDVDQKKTTIF